MPAEESAIFTVFETTHVVKSEHITLVEVNISFWCVWWHNGADPEGLLTILVATSFLTLREHFEKLVTLPITRDNANFVW
jgi:hypothetical protein